MFLAGNSDLGALSCCHHSRPSDVGRAKNDVGSAPWLIAFREVQVIHLPLWHDPRQNSEFICVGACSGSSSSQGEQHLNPLTCHHVMCLLCFIIVAKLCNYVLYHSINVCAASSVEIPYLCSTVYGTIKFISILHHYDSSPASHLHTMACQMLDGY